MSSADCRITKRRWLRQQASRGALAVAASTAALTPAQAQAPVQEATPLSTAPRPTAPLPAKAAIDATLDRLNTTGRPIDLLVPFRDRTPLGQVAIRIAPNDDVLVSLEDIANALSRVASADFLKGLRSIPAPGGFATLSALREAGLPVQFRPAELELVSDLSATSRERSRLNLGFGSEPGSVLPDQSEPFAVFAAVRGAADLVHTGSLTGVRSPRIDVELNGRFLGVAFENELTYDGNAEVPFSRFGSRAIYDRPDWNVRGTFGDLVSNPIGFQSTLDVLGVGVSRLRNSFGGDRIVTASSGRTITLREDARVTLIVNGVTVRTLDLPAGVFDLADLPLTSGANQVQLVVEDAAGGRRVVNFDFFQDFELLEPGDNEFDAQLGLRSTFRGTRRYSKGEPAISGFYRRGITPQFTAGANVQATGSARQLGIEGTVGTRLGLLTMEAAVSSVEDAGFGHAVRLQYRYTFSDYQLRNDRRLDVQVEHTSPNFGGVDDFDPFNSTGWRAAARYSQPLTDTISAGLGLDYSQDRVGPDRYGVRGTLSWQANDRTTVNTFTSYERREGPGFGFNLLVRLGRQSIATAQYDSLNDLGAVTFRHSPERILDTLAFGAQLNHAPDSLAFNGNAVYRTNRGDLELAHITAFNTDRNRISSQTSSLRYQGAIAYTGGRVAVGRYLFDSFAIVGGHKSLGGADILIGDRVNNRVEARTGALGPALVPLGSYSRRNIFYEVPDAPAGYDLGAGSFEVYPWLHSGFALVVGSEFNVTIIGTLLDDRGEPVRLVSGVARRVGDEKSPAVPIFTNRSGRLGASGLAPGRWQMHAAGFVYSFDIEQGQGTFADLKQVRPTGRQQEDPQ